MQVLRKWGTLWELPLPLLKRTGAFTWNRDHGRYTAAVSWTEQRHTGQIWHCVAHLREGQKTPWIAPKFILSDRWSYPPTPGKSWKAGWSSRHSIHRSSKTNYKDVQDISKWVRGSWQQTTWWQGWKMHWTSASAQTTPWLLQQGQWLDQQPQPQNTKVWSLYLCREMVTVGIINRRKQLQIHTMCIHHQLWIPGEMLEKLTSQSIYSCVYDNKLSIYTEISQRKRDWVFSNRTASSADQSTRQTQPDGFKLLSSWSRKWAESMDFLVFVRHPTPHKGTKVSMYLRFLQYFTRLSSLVHPHVSTCVYFPPRGADCNSSSSMADLSATKKYKKQHKLSKTVSKGIKTQGMKSSHLGMPNSIEIIYIHVDIFPFFPNPSQHFALRDLRCQRAEGTGCQSALTPRSANSKIERGAVVEVLAARILGGPHRMCRTQGKKTRLHNMQHI